MINTYIYICNVFGMMISWLRLAIRHLTYHNTVTSVPNISALVTATGYRLPGSRDPRELDFHLEPTGEKMLHHLGLSHFTFTKKPHKGCSKFWKPWIFVQKTPNRESTRKSVRQDVCDGHETLGNLRSCNPALWTVKGACSLSWWIAKIDPSCMLRLDHKFGNGFGLGDFLWCHTFWQVQYWWAIDMSNDHMHCK